MGPGIPERPFDVDAMAVLPGLVLSFRERAPSSWDSTRTIAVELPSRLTEHGGQDWVLLLDDEHARWLTRRAHEIGIELHQDGHATWRLTPEDAARLVASMLELGAKLVVAPPDELR